MASLLSMFTDPLGFSSINKQRRAADRFAKEMYDPNVFNPMIEETRRMASEGVDDASMRNGYLQRLFGGQPQRQASAFGGNQAALIASQVASNATLAGIQAGAELDIESKEEEAIRSGRMSLAQLMSQAKQTQATQDAAIEQNKMFAEASKQANLDNLVGGVVGLGLEAVGGGAGIGSFLKNTFGGNKAVETVANTVASNASGFDFTPFNFGKEIDLQSTFQPSLDIIGANIGGTETQPQADMINQGYEPLSYDDTVFDGGGDPNDTTKVKPPVIETPKVEKFALPFENAEMTAYGLTEEQLLQTLSDPATREMFLKEGDFDEEEIAKLNAFIESRKPVVRPTLESMFNTYQRTVGGINYELGQGAKKLVVDPLVDAAKKTWSWLPTVE